MYTEAVVIGGGAAGFMAAVTAKENGLDIIIMERKDRVLKKVLATGNGRCNYTNINADISNYYGEDKEFAQDALEIFSPENAVNFFEKLGIVHKVEENGKVYPYSGQASAVVDALRFETQRLEIPIYTNFDVSKIEYKNSLFKIFSSDGNRIITCKKLILAAGGCSYPELGSNGSGYRLAEMMGHKATEVKPALVQLKTEKEPVKGLHGIKVNAKITACHKEKELDSSEGELLFTDYGISGPVVFNLSYLSALYNNPVFKADLMPDYNIKDIEELLAVRRGNLSHLTMEDFLVGMLNKKLGQLLLKRSGIEKLSLPVTELSDERITKIAFLIKNYDIKILETTGFRNAQVTAGGIKTDGINSKTMESKKVKNLYFAGEILDVFGDCGGYNLQWAWSSGYLAGKSAAGE
ncbi:NAD(P)/FAD-dependent oxidoreductase [Sebaldella sp. S0638]|uniref:NAD(P)/FAD-dependent oxidoreductase n=1 Tax=Sebaldella sp. S0638 TaxID=2957809 RepID=UPI00209D2DDC|nr:NAD(P)/FAD-dependent oxidoreductase [Sebaldella sp. S0638]MCP1225596.1 NAD(P)/FAD-dependent oxidoreductase [Sebaldella sp. S0638]